MTETESMAPAATAAPVSLAGDRRLLATLGVAMLGFFVVTMDAQIVNVALPSIRHALGGGLSGLQWVVTGYTLTFSALILFAGTFSDRVGARRAYGTGMVVFALASAVCGLAPNLGVLVAARLVQGAGAALVTPTSLALIREAFHDPAQRVQAIAMWAVGGSVAAAAGPILGGTLTEVDWRWIFWVNIPAAALALLILSRVPPSPRREAPFDWTGQAAAIAALGSFTYAVIEGTDKGWGSALIVGLFILAVLAAGVFLSAQSGGRHPMVPLDLFRSRQRSVALTVGLFSMLAFYGVVFVQSLYFQQQRGASALQTGLLFLPMTGLVTVTNPFAPRLASRFSTRALIATGLLLQVAGLILLVALPGDVPTWAVALVMILVGVGGTLTVPPVAGLVIDSAPAERAGTASGVLNTARQMGGSLGVAAIGAVIASQHTFMRGLHVGLTAAAIVLALTAALSLTLRPTHH